MESLTLISRDAGDAGDAGEMALPADEILYEVHCTTLRAKFIQDNSVLSALKMQ